MIWNGIITRLMTECTKVLLMCTFRNEKIKNALKCFFLDLKEGEAFSLVHLPMILVQHLGFSDNGLCVLSSWLCFLLGWCIFLYKQISCIVGYGFCMVANIILTIAYGSCTIVPLNCKVGA